LIRPVVQETKLTKEEIEEMQDMVEDIRSLIEKLDKVGQLRRIDGADWNLEIGTITEIVAQRKGPTLLFDEIKDYPKG